MKSIFTDKKKMPDNSDLAQALGSTHQFWQTLRDYILSKSPNATEEWNYSGDKYGWSFRIKDKKRVIVYFLPRNKFFKVAFVFGQKATDVILQGKISEDIKKELESAKVYAEGRGVRIEIKNERIVNDIKILTDIKMSN